MMAMKATVFCDGASFLKIMQADNPRDQKALGRKVVGFNKTVWDHISYELLLPAIQAKFVQNNDLLSKLLNQQCVEFIEASPRDRIWGIGYDAENALPNIKKWGENRLGKLITQVRNDLQHVVAHQNDLC
jgi:ribA/ribD-fused uncharacterized protein